MVLKIKKPKTNQKNSAGSVSRKYNFDFNDTILLDILFEQLFFFIKNKIIIQMNNSFNYFYF